MLRFATQKGGTRSSTHSRVNMFFGAICALYSSVVFVVAVVAVGLGLGAYVLPVPFVAGCVLLYSPFLDLVDLADCFE